MSQIDQQIHDHFKVFTGEITNFDELSAKVSAFAVENKIAAKSIGVEYLESAGKLVVTLGYRADEEFYPISLHAEIIGKIDALGSDFTALEQKMAEASRKVSNIICHELFITENNDFQMIFMTTEK